jgi:anaerobic magnesium-protoporphyrin IX monomethyl ester cyclase
MKVLFLEIDTERQWAVASIGPAFLTAWLRRHGHQAALLRIAPRQSVAAVIAAIRDEAPDLLGLSLTSRQWSRGSGGKKYDRPANW